MSGEREAADTPIEYTKKTHYSIEFPVALKDAFRKYIDRYNDEEADVASMPEALRALMFVSLSFKPADFSKMIRKYRMSKLSDLPPKDLGLDDQP